MTWFSFIFIRWGQGGLIPYLLGGNCRIGNWAPLNGSADRIEKLDATKHNYGTAATLLNCNEKINFGHNAEHGKKSAGKVQSSTLFYGTFEFATFLTRCIISWKSLRDIE